MYAQGGPPAMVGTGPFVFKEWVTGDHVTLTKNPNYWNAAAGGPYLDAITFKPITDTTATLNALQSGDVDIAQTLAPGRRPDGPGRHQAPVLRPRQRLQHGRPRR